MFGLFKKLIGTSSLCEIGRSGDMTDFARRFASSEITVLSLPLPESIDQSSLNRDQLLELIEKAAKEVAQQTSVTPFTYLDGDDTLLPVFTDIKAAEIFLSKYVSELNRAIPFGAFSIQGAVLSKFISDDTNVVLNAKNDLEFRFSAKDLV